MFTASDRFDLQEMQAFMRVPEIYWAGTDALAPPPEALDFVGYMTQPTVWTVAGLWREQIIGYVQVWQRTSVGGEIHCAFHPQCRGKVAKTVGEFAVAKAFTEKGFLKLWCAIPADNREAVWGARLMGFVPEGRIRKAIARGQSRWGPAGLYDMILFGLTRDEWRH